MKVSASQFAAITDTLQQSNLPTINPAQANALVECLGKEEFGAIVRAARESGHREPLRAWVSVVRLHARLTALDIEADLRQLHNLLSVVETQRIVDTINDAEAGNAVARRILMEWIRDPAEAGSAEPNAAERRAPVHPTKLAPPATEQSSDAASSAPSAATQARARQGQQVQRSSQGTAPRQAQTGSRSATVTQLRPGGDHESDADAPARSGGSVGSSVHDLTYDTVKVFGRDGTGATAMSFSRSVDNKTGVSTINLAIARAKGTRTQDGCDWDRRIEIKLTHAEVSSFLKVLMGYVPEARFAGHGTSNDKWLSVRESEPPYAGSILVTIAQGQDRRSCSITPDDLDNAIGIFSRAYSDQTGLAPLTTNEVLARLGPLQMLHKASVEQRKSRARAG